MCAFFSPEILQTGAVKGLMVHVPVHDLRPCSLCVAVKTEVSSDSEQSSTSVLATLAALAEATGPMNAASELSVISGGVFVCVWGGTETLNFAYASVFGVCIVGGGGGGGGLSA